ncbi:MAG: discoidin domain-containing protein [Paludibacteraceae bacterium]|nr:discoidin domain-containing protein [Paludibacteraceae bacterium]MBP9970242.1 discoidin domain-containing protein [Paludibacteraceae bacterium]
MKRINKLIMFSAIIACCINTVNAENKCSSNIALNKPATASSSTETEFPIHAVDGNLSTNWCTPGFNGWITVDLQNTFSIDSIKLYVNQYIAGNTEHEIKISDDMDNWILAKTLSGETYNNQTLTIKFDPALLNVRGVKIHTLNSNSWVSWYEIEVYATPAKPTISQEGELLTSSFTTNNQWYFNGNPIQDAIYQTYTATLPGSYQVSVSYGDECESMSEILALTTTGVNENSTNDVRIYPNPSKDNIIVEGVKNGILEIINLQGKIVKYTPIPDSITRIDISQLTEGIYSLKITTNEGIIVKKLIKQ